MIRTRRTYSADERGAALSMFERGCGVGEVSRALGIPKSTVRGWRKRASLSPCQQDESNTARNTNGTFKRGISGNPRGSTSATKRARAILEDHAEMLVVFQLELLERLSKCDDYKSISLAIRLSDSLLDRALGKPTTTQHVTTDQPRSLCAEELASWSDAIDSGRIYELLDDLDQPPPLLN